MAPVCPLQFDRKRDFGGAPSGKVEGAAAQDGDVGRAVILVVAGASSAFGSINRNTVEQVSMRQYCMLDFK